MGQVRQSAIKTADKKNGGRALQKKDGQGCKFLLLTFFGIKLLPQSPPRFAAMSF